MSDSDTALIRLALLLAGAGARCRRVLASARKDDDPLEFLSRAGGKPALLRSARRMLADEVPRLIDRLRARGWRWMGPGESGYPPLLGHITDPPLGLFVRGRTAPGPAVAVVGSRRATPYGRQVARLLGEELAAAGVVLVSGMARGVDGAAHEAVLAASGSTWAVWGAGPDRVYPAEHRDLAEAIASTGAVMTEYPPGTPPRRHHFPERNRIIAGIAAATVVVEAAARSGALVTARQAVDEGREVFAVPGSIFSAQSIGPNTLIELGARPLLAPGSVIEAVGGSWRDPGGSAGLARPSRALEAHIDAGEAVSVDDLAARSGRTAEELATLLLELELDGLIERQSDGRYALRGGMARRNG
jgi:DNA processing protein